MGSATSRVLSLVEVATAAVRVGVVSLLTEVCIPVGLFFPR